MVIDPTARRAVVKTTPAKPMTDVLQEACAKLGYDPSQHGLKYDPGTPNSLLKIVLSNTPGDTKTNILTSHYPCDLRASAKAQSSSSFSSQNRRP